MLHFSGEVTIRANQGLKPYSTQFVGCSTTTIAIGGIFALGTLLLVAWFGGTRFLHYQRVQYEPVFEDEKVHERD